MSKAKTMEERLAERQRERMFQGGTFPVVGVSNVQQKTNGDSNKGTSSSNKSESKNNTSSFKAAGVNSSSAQTMEERLARRQRERAFGSYNQHSTVSRNATQNRSEEEDDLRDATLKDLLWNSAKRGYYNSRLGEESFDEMMGWDNEKAKYEEILSDDDYQFETDKWWQKGISGASELAGQMARQFTNPTTLAAGAAGAGGALALGQAGPQIALPEEIITVPGAFAAGITAGSAKANLEIEAGHAYNEMIEQGIDPKVAKNVAMGVGGVNAALEMLQVDELFDAYKVLSKTGATDGVTKRIVQELIDRGVDVGKETLQEVAQEGVTIAGTQFANKHQTGEWAYDSEDVLGRLGDTALSSALSFGAMNVPSGGMHTAQIINENKQMSDIGKNYQSVAQEAVDEGLSFDENTTAYKTASEVKAAMDANKALSDAALGRVIAANEEAIRQEERLARQNTAPQTASETVAEQAVEAEQGETQSLKTNVPYNVLSANNPQRMTAVKTREAALKKAGFGEHGTKELSHYADQNSMSIEEAQSKFQSAYEAGRLNTPRERIELLTDVQQTAYNAGRMDYIANMAKTSEKAKNATVYNGGIIETDSNSDVEFVTNFKKTNAKDFNTINEYGKKTGTRIIFDKTMVGGDANGYYENGEIHISPDAQNPMIVVARHEVTHRMKELAPAAYTKFRDYAIQQMSTGLPVGNTAIQQMQADYRRLSNGRVNLDTEGAMDEIAALYAEKIFTDKETQNSFIEHGKKNTDNRTMVQKFFDSVKKFIENIKKLFHDDIASQNKAAEEQYGATVSQLEEGLRLWNEALSASEKAVQEKKQAKSEQKGVTETDGLVTNAKGEPVARIHENGSAQFSLKTYKADGRAYLQNWLNKKVKSKALTREDADDIVKQLDGFYDICKKYENKYAPFGAWSNAEVVTDKNGKPVFSVVKKNGEYAMNLDFSLVCKKRRTLDAVFSEMIDRGMIDTTTLTEEDIVKINDIIRDNGFETACALCFVDSKRYRQGKVAESFEQKYNEVVNLLIPEDGSANAHRFNFMELAHYKDSGVGIHTLSDAELKEGLDRVRQYMKEQDEGTVSWKIAKHILANPQDRRLISRAEFMNTKGFEAVTLKNPAIMKLYNSSKGSGGPKAAFSDVQYLGDILKKTNFTPKKAYAVGGVRIQSFSDYVPRLVFDYLQMIADLAAKKLPAHAYTKEATFAQQFGMTGIKINMSLVPAIDPNGVAPGLDAKGNYLWKDGQSFGSDVQVKGSGQTGFELAVKIQNAKGYSTNCGTIAVGVSYKHIRKMLDDPDIRMIIPYHKSSLNHIVAMMNNIDKYVDFTGVQNTRDQNGTKITGKDFNYNESLRKHGDAKKAADEYVAWCKRNNYIPKFDDPKNNVIFSTHPNYYKLLEDFSTYDNGVNAPQGAVTMTFPKEGDAFGSMADLIKQGLEEDALLEGRRSKDVPKIVDQIGEVLGKKQTVTEMDGSQVQYSLRKKAPPKKTQYGFKLMTVDENGLPHAMFIDNATAMEYNTWYDADSPALKDLENLEAGFSYLIDSEGNAIQKQTKNPSKAQVNSATENGQRWMQVAMYSDKGARKGQKAYYNWGINGSGTISKFALRPGLHAVDIPSMRHIGAQGIDPNTGKAIKAWRRPDQRWFLIEYPVDEDYNAEAYNNPTKDIPSHIPEDGWYSFQTNSGAEKHQHWFITGAMRIVGAISEADAARYTREFGEGVQPDLPYQDGVKNFSEDDAIDLYEYIRTTDVARTPTKSEMKKRIEAEISGKQYSLKSDREGYSTEGANWVYQNVLEKKDMAQFWKTIANLNKRGYYIPKTKDGLYIVESGNNLIFTDGDYKAPTIETVIRLNDTSETNMALAKELIYDEESQYGGHDVSKRVIEDVYGEGYVSEFHREDYVSDEREVQRGKRADREDGSEESVKQLSLKGQSDLLKENAKLKEVNRELRDQFKRTKFAMVDKKSLDKFTKRLLKDYSSGAEINDTREALNDLYKYIANGEDGMSPSWDEVQRRAYDVAVSVLEGASTVNDELYQQYSELRETLRTVGITLDRQYTHDLIGYENLEAFRKANFGRIKIVKNGTPVDVFYQNLAMQYPEFFDDQVYTTQPDQLMHIEEVLDKLRPTEFNPFSYNMRESATWLANDIIERFFELPQAKPTFADKADAKLGEQKYKDRQKLDRLRAEKNAKIAKLIEENREKVNKVTQKERAKQEKLLERIDGYKEKQASAKARGLRDKVERHAAQLHQKLMRPSDKQHIPEEYRGLVLAVLESINLESRFDYEFGTDGKYHRVERGTVLGAEPTKRTQAFIALKERYAQLAADGDMIVDPDLLGDEETKGKFDQIIAMADTPIASMNGEQLQVIWDVLRSLEHGISTAGKTLSKAKYARTVEWANAMVDGTSTRKSKKNATIEKFRIDLENPLTFFSHYGEAGKAVFRMLRDAQDHQQEMVSHIQSEVQKIVDGKSVEKWEKDIHNFTTERGDKLTLSTAHCMEIYLLMKREQARDHLMKGGIVQPEIKGILGKRKKITRGTDSVLLSAEDLSKIIGTLNEEQRNVADALQRLTATTLADYGNEASMKAYGYKKFTGKDYWTIKSAKEGIHSNVEKGGSNTRSIRNISLANSVVPHANNPLDISGVFKTFAAHAGDMTDYAAWLCPMEDANRLFNFRFRDADGSQTGKTIKGLLDRVGGKGAQQYWSRLMEDIQNGLTPTNDSAFLDPINKVIGNVKGASVGANIRVIVQQPTAFLRAGAVLSPENMVKGLATGVTDGSGWKKALEHSAIAKRKDMGGFDISSPMQMNEILFDSKDNLQRFNDAMMVPAGVADAVTWGRIWNACEWEVKNGNPDLRAGTNEFYEAVAEKFTEVIDQSQVVDGVLQRSQTMRSGNAIMKQATAFMGEPTMSMNMLLRAYDAFANEQNTKARSKALKVFGHTASALMFTTVVNALAQSLVDAWRDDDEDKKYWERFWSAFTGLPDDEEMSAWDKAMGVVLSGNLGAGLNPVGYVPIAKDLLSILQGYNVTRADADAMGDIITAFQTFYDSVAGDGKKTIAYASKNLVQQVCKVGGISAPNVLRDVWGIMRSIAVESDNVEVQYEMEKAIYKITNSSNNGRYLNILYRAYEQGDKVAYDHIVSDMIANGIEPSTIESGIKSRAKKAGIDANSLRTMDSFDFAVGLEPKYGVEKEEDDKFTIDDLSASGYSTYRSQYGSIAEDIIDDFQSHGYYKLDDETANKLLGAAYSYAEAQALAKASGGRYEIETEWMLEAKEAEKNGLDVGTYIYFDKATTGMSKVEKLEFMDDMNLDSDEYNALLEAAFFTASEMKKVGSALDDDQYDDYAKSFMNIYENVEDSLEGNRSWSSYDEKAQDKILGYAESFTREYVLELLSNGRYNSTAEFGYVTVDDVMRGLDDGLEMDEIFEGIYQKNTLPGIKDSDGKTVRNSVKNQFIEWMEDKGYSRAKQRAMLKACGWSTKGF